MASRRQLEANRSNAKRSTGPNSQRGKARSRMNALKHGLTASDIVIGDEDPKHFDALRGGLKAGLRPVGAMEIELVDRVAGLLWRLRRVPVVESGIIRSLREEMERSDQPRDLSAAEMKSH